MVSLGSVDAAGLGSSLTCVDGRISCINSKSSALPPLVVTNAAMVPAGLSLILWALIPFDDALNGFETNASSSLKYRHSWLVRYSLSFGSNWPEFLRWVL